MGNKRTCNKFKKVTVKKGRNKGKRVDRCVDYTVHQKVKPHNKGKTCKRTKWVDTKRGRAKRCAEF